jgi:tRNA-dihydrouridine synthase 2
MIARGAEGNPSCFSSKGVASIPEVIAPAWIRYALTFENNYGNTKYCLNSLAFKPSSTIVPNARPLQSSIWNNKQKFIEVRSKISQAKSVEEMGLALGVDVEAQKTRPVNDVLQELKQALESRYDEEGKRRESRHIHKSTSAIDSGNEMTDTEAREPSINVV